MSDLYCITGFLGSGKTTFLRNFIRLFSDARLRLIINEFGRQGLDGTLLSDLHAALQEITGGSVFCACRFDQFEAALREAGEDETILVEASGLSDPTGIRRLFSETDRFPHIRFRGAVCLADAVRFPKLTSAARCCIRQLAAADAVILNKTDLASPEQLRAAKETVHGLRPDLPLFETTFGAVPEGLLTQLSAAAAPSGPAPSLIADVSVKRLSVRLSPEISAYALTMFLRMFAENTFRIKGLVRTADKGLMLCDCVGSSVSVTPSALVPDEALVGVLTILSGAKMPVRSAVRHACEWYRDFVLSME